jgi:hypothetical protein
VLWILDNGLIYSYTYINFFVNTYLLHIETPRLNTNRHVHAHKCLHWAVIEPATSCVVGETCNNKAYSKIKSTYLNKSHHSYPHTVSPDIHIYIHTYHSRFIPEGVAEISQTFLRDTHVLPKLAMRNTEDMTGGKPIAVSLQFISGIIAINPLVAIYDIHGGKREVLFFYFVPDTTRDIHI